MLTPRTEVYVICRKDGDMSMMPLDGWFNSLKGGSRWEDYEVTTNKAEAARLEQKYSAVSRMVELMRNMTPEQAKAVVLVIQDREELMNT